MYGDGCEVDLLCDNFTIYTNPESLHYIPGTNSICPFYLNWKTEMNKIKKERDQVPWCNIQNIKK